MTVQTVPAFLQNASHSAALFRQSASAPFISGGILAAGELTITQQATPNMSVVLGAGRAKVPGTSVSPPSGLSFTTQGMYDVLNDAPLTLTVAAADATNPRIDVPYIQVQDSFYSGAANQAIAGIVTGTPAPSPVAPAVPSNAIGLAGIAVAANATSIVSANIAAQATVAQVIPSTSQGVTRIIPTSVSGTGVSLGPNGKITLTAATAASVNGCFTTMFDNYVILWDIPTIATSANLLLRLRAAGTDLSTSTYNYGAMNNNASAAVGSASTTTGFYLTFVSGGLIIASGETKVFSPALAQSKRTVSAFGGANATFATANLVGGNQNSAVAYDGLTFTNDVSSAMTGSFRIYGYNNN